MKWHLSFFLSLSFSFSIAQTNYCSYVNPFIGTGGHGHTFPGAVLPFGMVQLSPDTRIDGSWDGCSGYHYSDSIIYGFTHTHLSGTGCSDYGDILLMPTTDIPVLQPLYQGDFQAGYASAFSHGSEKASPGYYAVHLNDDNIDVELTATNRVGMHHYHYPKCYMKNIILDLNHRDKVLDSYFHVLDSFTVVGYRRSQAWAENQVVYFTIKFSEPIKMFGYSVNDTMIYNENLIFTEVQGKNLKCYFGFDPAKSSEMFVKVGISQTGIEGAQKNLETELPGWDFEKVKADATAAWNKELSKIEVSGGTEDQKAIFYTSLYHCMIHPSLADDVDGKYLGRDFNVHQLEAGHHYYTVFSLWDTYRALHPLLTIIDSTRTVDFIRTFLLEYQQGGRLPVWELSSNETDCMIGYHVVSVIADAAMKGIKGFNLDTALMACISSANSDARGLGACHKQGYISMEDDGESVSKTLEYAYDDWCIALLAGQITHFKTDALGVNPIDKEFLLRSENWENIFDRGTNFMRARKNGGWNTTFDPYEVNFNYTEANAWQYCFAVPQDIRGLMQMMHGKDAFTAKLDSLFTAPSKITGREQPDISGMIGQYAHGNEPSHHLAYLYEFALQPWKTEELVRKIMNDFYKDSVDGLTGNEDCGQMSAWYVFSAMGFYPVTPGSAEYVYGSPLFTQMKIHTNEKTTFTLNAFNNSSDNKYIQSISVNERVSNDSLFISDYWIRRGSTINLQMGQNPRTQFASFTQVTQYIGPSVYFIVVDPIIQATAKTFTDSMLVSISCPSKKNDLRYTIDGTAPTKHSLKYSTSFYIKQNTIVRAVAYNETGDSSKIVEANYFKTNKNWKVNYLTSYDPQYTGEGNMTLMDEENGTTNFRNGQWQGWQGTDMELLIDLGAEKNISKVGAEFLQDQSPWIFFPKAFEVLFSSDGKNFHDDVSLSTSSNLLAQNTAVQTTTLEIPVAGVKARYLKIIAHNYGKLPMWHLSAGENAWIFCDEVFVE